MLLLLSLNLFERKEILGNLLSESNVEALLQVVPNRQKIIMNKETIMSSNSPIPVTNIMPIVTDHTVTVGSILIDTESPSVVIDGNGGRYEISLNTKQNEYNNS